MFFSCHLVEGVGVGGRTQVGGIVKLKIRIFNYGDYNSTLVMVLSLSTQEMTPKSVKGQYVT